MRKMFKKHRTLIILTICITIVVLLVIFISQGKNPVSRGSIRFIRSLIRSFGNFSGVAVIFLITLSTMIPPLPLPVPLIEIAAGLVFGFIPGFLICWIGQIISSLIAFYFARYFGKRVLNRLTKNKFFESYREYLTEKGPLAIFIVRATLANPFNIVSYLAGFTNMKVMNFLIPTILGSVTEALIFAFVGSRIRMFYFQLWYLFAFILITSAVGIIGTYIVIKRKHNTK